MIRVVESAFDAGAEIAAFTRRCGPDIGGIASFVGLVRNESHGTPVQALILEHYPGMTEAKLAEIEILAGEKWPLAESLIVHRVGRMAPGEAIVLVATASSHRQAAFDACQFLIDWLKTKAPFWKMEETPAGERWVEALASDDEAASRWNP